MKLFFISLAVLGGCFLPVQGALNSKLSVVLNHPLQATFVSYLGGLLTCCVLLLYFAPALPSIRQLQGIDWYLLCGGALGMVFVTSMLLLMPVIGVTTMLAAALVGQLIMASFLDHLGFMNMPIIKFDLNRLLGIGCLCLGLYLIQKSHI